MTKRRTIASAPWPLEAYTSQFDVLFDKSNQREAFSHSPDRQPGDRRCARTYRPESHELPALAHPGRSDWPGAHDDGSYSHDRNGVPAALLALEMLDGQIWESDLITNPDKLQGVPALN